jgi:hypothetical protein
MTGAMTTHFDAEFKITGSPDNDPAITKGVQQSNKRFSGEPVILWLSVGDPKKKLFLLCL